MYENINVAVGGPINAAYPKVYNTVFIKPNIPFALQVTEPNTKYVIRHKIDLGGNGSKVTDIDFTNAETHTTGGVAYYYVPITADGNPYTLLDESCVFITTDWTGLSVRTITPEAGTLFMIGSVTGGLHKGAYINAGVITMPENCILEFDGGSLDNGVILGQDTVFINVGDVDIWGENLTREGTWREHSGGVSIDVDDHLSDTSENPVQNKVINQAINEINEGKVDKIDGKTLTDNNFTNEEKSKLDSLPSNNAIQTLINSKQDTLVFDETPTSGSKNPVKSSGIKSAIDNEASTRASADTALSSAIQGVASTISSGYYGKTEIDNIISRTPETDVVIISVGQGETITEALDHVPVADRPNKLFRVPGPDNTTYSEWGWDGSNWVMLANKDYGIDSTPVQEGTNVITSGYAYDMSFAYDVSNGISIDTTNVKIFNAVIDAGSKEWTSGQNTWKCLLINVEHLINHTIRVETDYKTFLAVLSRGVEIGSPADFAGDSVFYEDNVITILPGTKYLYILKTRPSQDITISSIFDMGIYYDELRKTISLNGDIDISSLKDCGYIMNVVERVWRQDYNYNAKIIPVMDYRGGTCRIAKSEGSELTRYSFIKTLPTFDGDSVNFCDGETRHDVYYDVYDIAIPEDANYLYVSRSEQSNVYIPSLIQLTKKPTYTEYNVPIRLTKTGAMDVEGVLLYGYYQSMAAYGNYMVFVYGQSDNQNSIQLTIYDNRNWTRVGGVELPYDFAAFGKSHNNATVFSRTFYDGNAQFPLLYINQWGVDVDDYTQKRCFVYNLQIDESTSPVTFSGQLIQVIEPSEALCKDERFGVSYGDFVVDYDRNELVHIGYKSDMSSPNPVSRFSLPSPTDGTTITTAGGLTVKKVTLDVSDIIDWFDAPSMRGFQDKCYLDGQVFVGHGYSKRERERYPTTNLRPISIDVIDIQTHHVSTIVITERDALNEIEGVEVCNGKLLAKFFHEEEESEKYIYSVNI